MIPLEHDDIDQIIEEFSSDELVHLSDDLLDIAIELTLQDDLDLSLTQSISRGNDLLAIIPKVIASRLNKADVYSRKFASLSREELVFAGYSVEELRSIRKLLEDIILLVERRTGDQMHSIFNEVFEELKDSIEIDVELYRTALKNVNEAYKIQGRHVMHHAIDVYKHVNSYQFEHFLHQKLVVLEEYQRRLSDAIELLESSDMHEKYLSQLAGLRDTHILVLEALNTQTIGGGFSQKKFSYIHDILYHIREKPEDYIFRTLRRFVDVSPDGEVKKYMPPEEIAVRYKTHYLKHNRVLLSFISNPIALSQDRILEMSNNILKNLSEALNVKLQFFRATDLCDEILTNTSISQTCPYSGAQLDEFYQHLTDVVRPLEQYPVNSEYLEVLQGKCYQVMVKILEWRREEQSAELINLLQQYQRYTARRLFALRISMISVFISSHSAQQLAQQASKRLLTVCRDLIEYKYKSLKPSSMYLEIILNLRHSRGLVLSRIDTAIRHLQGKPSSKVPEKNEQLASEAFTRFARPKGDLNSFPFSQIIIDCLALKVQELDNPTEIVQKGHDTDPFHDLVTQLNTARERISYFLKQYHEEKQYFVTYFQKDESIPPQL